MQLSARILTALAVLTLALAYVAGAGLSSSRSASAATGVIDAINVGTCYTTDADALDEGDCGDDYDLAGRTEASEVSTLYATYAHDPKTSSEAPRAMLQDSDLLKISIEDTGRDKRTNVLIRAAGAPNALVKATDDKPENRDFIRYRDLILQDLGETDPKELNLGDDLDSLDPDNDDQYFAISPGDGDNTGNATLENQGINKLQVVRSDDEEFKPMAPKGGADDSDDSATFYGCVIDDGSTECASDDDFKNLDEAGVLTRDEDWGSGSPASDNVDTGNRVAPWLSRQLNAPDGKKVLVKYILYTTSQQEVLKGGSQDKTSETSPNFTNKEDSLLVEVESDGDVSKQNLYLKETERFTGIYEGYVRLTDANGDGSTNNWGRKVKHAEGPTDDEAAVIGVQSGPVTISYRDSDGRTQTLSIVIDMVPPVVQIDEPANGARQDDSSPEFVGSFTDDTSGLVRDSFRLYADNKDDSNEDGTSGDPVINLPVTVNAKNGKLVNLNEDYVGYTDSAPTFGIVGRDDIFFDDDDIGRDGDVQAAEADRYVDGDLEGTFRDSVRLYLDDPDEFNDTVDFQAFVIDRAGNVGFSDSSGPNEPSKIRDLGTESGKREAGKYNVIGWYARHILHLDEKDPEIEEAQTVTGFYGQDDDKEPTANRSGIMLVFDGAVDPDSFGIDTFDVRLDKDEDGNEAQATVIDILSEGSRVYLKLDKELASDATPSIDLVAGKLIRDAAGNTTRPNEFDRIDANDGISPVLKLELSDGSGTGTDGESASSLTNKKITVKVSSDEELQGVPSLTVVCSEIKWDADPDDDKQNDKTLRDFVNNRKGSMDKDVPGKLVPGSDKSVICEDEDEIKPVRAEAYARAGNNWEYIWVNSPTAGSKLADGKLTVVAFARDRSSHERSSDVSYYNWGVATAEFKYDSAKPAKKRFLPEIDVSEPRPFIMLEFDDESSVSVEEMKLDGKIIELKKPEEALDADRYQDLGQGRFMYWPQSLSLGSHTVNGTVKDAAGNSDSFEHTFTVKDRVAFRLKLIAGWNAVSFPANPIDPVLDSVFTDPDVDQVIGWDATDPISPWRIASKFNGVWTTNPEFATLNSVEARYGYWVHARDFTTQSVLLVGKPGRDASQPAPDGPADIPALTGWNFVGVIDQDGDQTEGASGSDLRYGADAASGSAGSYLGEYERAYNWNPILLQFEELDADDKLRIGSGVWVYFAEGFDIAP